jgi:hypothetical protein
MLTKTDLSQIRIVLREEVESESKTTRLELRGEIKLFRMRIEERLYKIEDKLKDLEIKTDSHFKKIEKELTGIKKDINMVAGVLDNEDVALRKRVARIESHLGLTAI